MKEKYQTYIRYAAFLGVAVSPALLGAALAWRQSGLFKALPFTVSLLLALFMLGAAADGSRGGFSSARKRMFFLALALLCLACLTFLADWVIALTGVALLWLAYNYGAGMAYRYKSFVALAAAYFYIILLVFLAYYAQAGVFSFAPLFSALSPAFLFTAILFARDLSRYDDDLAAGRSTLPVLMGRMGKKWAYYGQMENYIDAYIVLFILVALKVLPLFALLPVALILSLFDNIRQLRGAEQGKAAPAGGLTSAAVLFYLEFFVLLVLGIVIDKIIT